MAAYAPDQWTDLFVAAAGAAAALTGLVFVAVSINLRAILDGPGLPERALTTVVLLLGIAIVSILGLVPGQSTRALGAELLGEGLVLFAGWVALARVHASARDPEEPSYLLNHLWTTAPGVLPFIAGGASLLAGGGGGLYWTLGGIVGALLGGVINAWVLLVEILR